MSDYSTNSVRILRVDARVFAIASVSDQMRLDRERETTMTLRLRIVAKSARGVKSPVYLYTQGCLIFSSTYHDLPASEETLPSEKHARGSQDSYRFEA